MRINSRTLGIRSLIESWLMSKNTRRKVFRALSAQGYRVHRRFGDVQFVYDPSEAIGKLLDGVGGVNRSETEEVIRRGMAASGRTGGVYLELGANIGTQTVYAGRAFDFDRLVAVEPDPDNLEVLDINVKINDLADRTTLCPVAVSDAPATAVLQRSRRNSGISTLRRKGLEAINFASGGADTLASVEVPLITGDQLVADLGFSPEDISFLWIDIEGFEPQALAGMTEILSHAPPMFIEYTPAWLSEDERQSIEDILFETYNSITVYQTGEVLTGPSAFRKIEGQVDLFAIAQQ